jgi:DNA-binding CsgD family transcriptional regulator/PAS domain-containing protein
MRAAQGEERFDDLIKSIYATLGQRDLWPRVLDQICDAFGGTAVTRFEHNFGNRQGFIRHQCQHVDASANDAYVKTMCGRNPWLRSDQLYAPESVILGTEILPNSELMKTEFYGNYLRPLGLLHRLCGVVARDGLDVEFVAVLRAKGTKPFSERDKSRLRRLLPHLRQAWDLRRTLRAERIEHEALIGILDRVPIACILVDHAARIRYVNQPAERLLGRRDGLVAAANCVAAATSRESVRLRRMIGRLAVGAGSGPRDLDEIVIVSRPSERPPILLAGLCIRRREAGRPDRAGGLVALLAKDPEGENLASLDSFSAAYHLTKAESRLINLLARGRGLFEAASELGITKNTARTHMRHIYSKVGIHRQTDIIRLLAKLGMS